MITLDNPQSETASLASGNASVIAGRADASAFSRAAFDLDSYRRDGVQVVKDFFEPEIKARFKALGEKVVADNAAGLLGRSGQFALGVDLQTEVRPAESAALTAVAQELLGKDIGQFYMRLLMKDENFKIAIEVHQDWPYFGGDTKKLNVFIPLSHCGADNGMVQYYVGSHVMGPVERGDIDVVRYPQFEPVIPELEVGDVLFADFLTWHSSIESKTKAPRIMVQLVLQPLSDPSTSFQFGRPPEEWGASLLPRRAAAMRTARPSLGVTTVKELISYPALDEAARITRGLCFDSPMNVEARLLLAEIIEKKGNADDDLLNGLSADGLVSGLLVQAEDGLIELAKKVDTALGHPSRLAVELTASLTAELNTAVGALRDESEANKQAQRGLQIDLQASRDELTQVAGDMWRARGELEAAQAELAEMRAKADAASAELDAVLASPGWKLTAPLRRLGLVKGPR